MAVPTILQKILDRKLEEVVREKKRKSFLDQEALARHADPVRGFQQAIENKIASGAAGVIAEIKKASPSQ
ncbi:MAG: hypothetical protein Q8J78_04490, partial [Moraxellaceae bacterium]|nr:hypothetical protein [Moraxellaceae bacterium]